MNIEKKSVGLEIKELSEDGSFEGFGAFFNNVDFGDDVIIKGAFTESLTEKPIGEVRMLWQHKSDHIIGKFTEAVETDQGLFVKGKLFIDDIAKAKEAYKLLKEKAIGGMSIGYRVAQRSFKEGVRVLEKLSLHEISLVTFPMNELAKVTNVKSIKECITTEREFEKHLRDLGFSKKEALIISSKGFKSFLRDSVEDDQIKAEEAELIKLLKENKLN